MVAVAYCESRFRQIDEKTGKVLRGKVNKKDIGLFQVNEKYHAEKATSLGDDLHTVKGQLDYAHYLYDTEGLKPWYASRSCWQEKDSS